IQENLIIDRQIAQVEILTQLRLKTFPGTHVIIQGRFWKLNAVFSDRWIHFHWPVRSGFANDLFSHPTLFRDKDDDAPQDMCLTGKPVTLLLLPEIEKFLLCHSHRGQTLSRRFNAIFLEVPLLDPHLACTTDRLLSADPFEVHTQRYRGLL